MNIPSDSGAARTATGRWSAALRLVRLLSAAVLVVDALTVAVTEYVGQPLTAGLLMRGAQEALFYTALLLTLWRPVAGCVLGAFPLVSTAVLGSTGQEILLVPLTIVLVSVISPPRTRIAVGLWYMAFAAARALSGDLPLAGLASWLLVIAVAHLVGWGLRSAVHAIVASAAKIDALAHAGERMRVEERSALAVELHELLSEDLEANARMIEAASASPDQATLHGAVDSVEEASRRLLVHLRALVSTLRGQASGTAAAATPVDAPELRAVVEDVEENLVAYGFPVELDVAGDLDRLSDGVRIILARVIREAGYNMQLHAPPGTPCRIAITVDDRVELTMSNRYVAAGAPHLGAGLRALRERVELSPGTFFAGVEDGRWVLRVSLPLGWTADNAPPATPTLKAPLDRPLATTWRWIRQIGTVLLVIAAAAQVPLVRSTGPEPLLGMAALVAVAIGLTFPHLMLPVGALVLVGSAIVQPVAAVDVLVLVPCMLAWVAVTRSPRQTVLVYLGAVSYTALRTIGLPDSVPVWLSMALVQGLVALVGHAFGVTLRAQASRIDELRDSNAAIRAQERVALAGELHDLIAHQLSVITLGLRPAVTAADTASVQRALGRVAASFRSTQVDLNLLVHVLRSSDPALTASQPAPEPLTLSLAQVLSALEDTLDEEGFAVDTETDGDMDAVDATTRRTATRVLRESTTNILRYAPAGARCRLAITVLERDVVVDVASPLPHAGSHRPSPLSTGWGLRGLGERVSLHGGTFSAGPCDGAWRVRATIPRLGPAPAAAAPLGPGAETVPSLPVPEATPASGAPAGSRPPERGPGEPTGTGRPGRLLNA
ncbi:sensor histidine kinase [Nigerium massiliense]|uniref:sensor histidine kinase n=1 Tax=Nigerium massiliense TaxID=1522317 RepID=UPI00058DD615|nr:histidine kinase [Nigerium massiliense]